MKRSALMSTLLACFGCHESASVNALPSATILHLRMTPVSGGGIATSNNYRLRLTIGSASQAEVPAVGGQ